MNKLFQVVCPDTTTKASLTKILKLYMITHDFKTMYQALKNILEREAK